MSEVRLFPGQATDDGAFLTRHRVIGCFEEVLMSSDINLQSIPRGVNLVGKTVVLQEIIDTFLVLVALEKEQVGRPGASGLSLSFLSNIHFRLKAISKRFTQKDIRCVIVGGNKSGKSALVNALVGVEIMPESNEPKTSIVTGVRHVPGLRHPRIKKIAVEGAEAIRQYLFNRCDFVRLILQDNDSSQGVMSLDPTEERIDSWDGSYVLPSSDSQEKVVSVPQISSNRNLDYVVEVAFPFVPSSSLCKSRSFVIVDTPGMTEANGKELKEATFKCLADADVVLLLFNYTNLRSEAEEIFLKEFFRWQPGLFINNNDRLICVLTHFDQKDRHGMDIDAIQVYMHKNINAALPKSSLPFKKNILVVNPKLALLGRLAERGAMDPAQLNDYKEMRFGLGCDDLNLSKKALQAHGKKSVADSNLKCLEDNLVNLLVNNRNSIRIDAMTSHLLGCFEEVNQAQVSIHENAFIRAVMKLREQVVNI
jgi:GTPase SAR1 family protein